MGVSNIDEERSDKEHMNEVHPQALRPRLPLEKGLVGVVQGDDKTDDKRNAIDGFRRRRTIQSDIQEKGNDRKNVEKA